MPVNQQSRSRTIIETTSLPHTILTRIGPLFDSDSNHSFETRASLTEAIRICDTLRDAGHVAYFAGGCVRDALLGLEPKDFDVATDATPDRVREIFGKRKTLAFGASFGVIGVLPARRARSQEGHNGKGLGGNQPTEVATFRSDGEYSDGRRPDKVHYGDAKHDALRRDFTINGLFFDPATETVIDFVGGQQDLKQRRLRTIGAAAERFDEDKLRMLRAVRFATTLEFEIDAATQAEIVTRADQIVRVSAERIGAEMRRLVTSLHASRGLRVLVDSGLARSILPDLDRVDVAVAQRLLAERHSLAIESSLTLILLGILRVHPETTFADLINDVAQRWRLANEETRRVKKAAKHWQTIHDADALDWAKVQPVLVDRDIETTLQVAMAISAADGGGEQGIARCQQALSWPAEQLDPAPLITGETLREAGYRPGPEFRSWLQSVRDAQLNGQITDREQALALVRQLD